MSACSEEIKDPNNVLLGSSFELSEDRTTQVQDNGEYVLTVYVQSIEDSRCPEKATCFSAGNAVVVLQVNGNEEKITLIELCTGLCPNRQNEASVEIDNVIRTFRLVDVRPYPQLDKDPIQYAVLLVE